MPPHSQSLVGQVREALAAARVRAVAGGAVVDEQALADAHAPGCRGPVRSRSSPRSARTAAPSHCAPWPARPRTGRCWTTSGCRRSCPARDRAPGRQTANTHGDDEQPHPPARQRVVQFAQVLVPDVAGGVVVDASSGRPPARGDEQQHEAGERGRRPWRRRRRSTSRWRRNRSWPGLLAVLRIAVERQSRRSVERARGGGRCRPMPPTPGTAAGRTRSRHCAGR